MQVEDVVVFDKHDKDVFGRFVIVVTVDAKGCKSPFPSVTII